MTTFYLDRCGDPSSAPLARKARSAPLLWAVLTCGQHRGLRAKQTAMGKLPFPG
jgi:hypothetical protein